MAQALAFLALYAAALLSGRLALRRLLPGAPPWLAWLLAFPFGLSLFLVLANTCVHLAGYASGIRLGAGATLACGVAAHFSARRRGLGTEAEPLPGISGKWGAAAAVLVLALGSVVGLENTTYLALDSQSHGTVFAQYATYGLSWPVDTIYAPPGDLGPAPLPKRLLYHIGHELIHAALVSLSGLPHQWAFLFTSTLSILLVFALVFALVCAATDDPCLGLAAAAVVPFSGYRFPWIMHTPKYHVLPPDGSYILFSVVLGLGLLILAMSRRSSTGAVAWATLLTVAMAALELVNETLLIAAWPAALALLLARDRRGLAPYLAATAAAGGLIILFGGIIGGMLRGDASYTYAYVIHGLSLRLRLADFLHIDPFYGQAFPVYSPRYLLANPIVPLAFAAGAACVFLSWRRGWRTSPALWLFWGVAALGYLVPGSIDFGYPQNVDAIRFVNQTSWAVGPLAVVAGGCLLARLPAARRHWGLACLALALAAAALHSGSLQAAARLLGPDLAAEWRQMRNAIQPTGAFLGKVNPGYKVSQAEYGTTMDRVRRAQEEWGVRLPPYDLNRRGPGRVEARAGDDRETGLPLDRESLPVALDAGHSTCEDCSIVDFAWIENGRLLARGPRVTLDLGPGEHALRLVVEDNLGRRSQDEVRVELVESMEGFVNCALAANGGKASAQGSLMGLPAQNAIDGRTGGVLADSWTSEADAGAFWQVDLGAPKVIRVVRIRFRSDHHEDSQTSGIALLGSNDPAFGSCEQLAARPDDAVYPPGGKWKAVVAPTVPLQYVRLSKATPGLTSLEEIEVYCSEEAADAR